MSFIGIFANNKDFAYINQKILEYMKNKNYKIDVIQINKTSVENLKNIKFETIIINSKLDRIENKQNMENILKNAKYLLINSDIEIKNDLLKNINLKIITYGLNQKSTLTVSSVMEEEILICLQRNIQDISHNVIEAYEFEVVNDKEKIHNILAISAFKQIYN